MAGTAPRTWITPPPIIAPKPKWLIRPLWVLLGALPFVIGLLVPGALFLACLLAYINVLAIGWAMMQFAKQRSLQSVLHILYLTWLLASWPLATIYLSIAMPGSYYLTMHERRLHLQGVERVQIATMVFLAVYLPLTLLQSRRSKPFDLPTPASATDRRTATVMLITVIGAILMNATSKVAPFPGPLQYIADGGYNYLHSLMLLVGVLFPRLPFYTQGLALGFMTMAGGFYVIGNQRGQAALPFALFLTGLLFFSEMKPRIKMTIVVVGSVVLPLVLALSDVTRDLTGSGGFGNISARIEALSRIGEYAERTPLFARSFQRTYFTGGHTLITMMPDRYTYLPFSIKDYVAEFFGRLLPAKIYYNSYYSSTGLLRNYDFMITDKTSVELSFIGSLYMLGGYIPIALGTFFVALVHGWFGRWVERARRVNPYKGLFYCGMLAQTFLWGQNLDIISHFRILVWQSIAAVVLYFLIVRVFVGQARAVPFRPEDLPTRLQTRPQAPSA